MRDLSGSEVKVYLTICRKTFGWNKDTDYISLSQIEEFTGLRRAATVSAIASLLTPGKDGNPLILAEKVEGRTTKYGCYFQEDKEDQFEKRTGTSSKSEPVTLLPLVRKANTQNKEDQEKETLKEKEKKNTTNIDGVPSVAEKSLYHAVEQAFLSRNDGKFTDYGKEGKAINGLIKKATSRSPGEEGSMLKEMISKFWVKRCNGDKFWKGQPFLPSTLNSSGIWDRVLETMRTAETTVDPVAMAVAGGRNDI